jgi:hypothetical protein
MVGGSRMARLHGAKRCVAPLLLGLTFGGCGRTGGDSHDSASRYVVTASPISVGVGSGLCVAIDPNDPKGVWWWQPGRDCSSRSTGPTVFHAEHAAVTPSGQPGTADIRFRVPVKRHPHSSEPPFVEVSLRLEGSRLRAAPTGSQIATVTRHDLEIPEAWR